MGEERRGEEAFIFVFRSCGLLGVGRLGLQCGRWDGVMEIESRFVSVFGSWVCWIGCRSLQLWNWGGEGEESSDVC
jgi:hypothetical protein